MLFESFWKIKLISVQLKWKKFIKEKCIYITDANFEKGAFFFELCFIEDKLNFLLDNEGYVETDLFKCCSRFFVIVF